ncbi:MAG TPA: hypothetical protein VF162_14920 [Streptosporangiaceae bacterium]
MRAAHPGLRAAQATLKSKRAAASLAAAAGLIVIATGALAGCGTVRASGAAAGSGGGQARSGQSAGGHGQAGGHAGSGNAGPSGQRASGRPVTSGGVPMIRLLCAEPRGVTAVRVARFGARGQTGDGATALPRPIPGITISDPLIVRELVTVICGLPHVPRGVVNCPADLAVGYVLVFSGPGERFHAVTLLATGCETVTGTGAGRARWVAKTPVFWAQFAHLTGIGSAAHT